MDSGFLTTVLAGIIVAMIGGIIAFYFGGVRESQKREDERAKDLNERRIEAVDAMRPRVRSVGNAFLSWTEKLMTLEVDLPESLPATKQYSELAQLQQSITALSGQLEELGEQAEKNQNDMASLWNFYEEQRPYLDGTTRNIIESFANDFERRHTSVVNALAADPTAGAQVDLDPSERWTPTKGLRDAWSEDKAIGAVLTPLYVAVGPIIWAGGKPRREFNQKRQEHWEQLRQAILNYLETVKMAAKRAQDWNLQAHFNAFDAEAMRLVNARP